MPPGRSEASPAPACPGSSTPRRATCRPTASEVKVKGLVIDPNDPQAIAANLAGVNPSATFLAAVSCLAADGTTHNVFSDPFPATTGLGGGDAKVEVQLTLPQPCIAPIVFVTSPGRAWFATTGG